jgi:hypothetical protein
MALLGGALAPILTIAACLLFAAALLWWNGRG